VSWSVILSRNAVKDLEKLGKAGLKSRVEHLLKLLKENPFEKYPRYEKLVGNLEGYYSRRINIQHVPKPRIGDKKKKIFGGQKMNLLGIESEKCSIYEQKISVEDKDISVLTDEEIKAQISAYENKFGISSEEFLRRKRNGTADDTFETMDWTGLLFYLSGACYDHI